MLILGLEVPLWSVLLPTALYLLYKFGTRNFDTWEKQGLAGPKPIPFLGTAMKMLRTRSFPPIDREYQKKYGNKWGEFMGNTPTLILGDPELVRIAMIKEFHSLSNRHRTDVGPTMNRSLTILRDDHWKHVRQLLTPAFTTGRLKQMKPLIHNCVKRLIKNLKENGESVEIKKYCAGFTMEVISSTAFGIEVDSQSNPDSEILKNARVLMRQPEKNPSLGLRLRDYTFGLIFFVLPSYAIKLLMKVGLHIVSMDSIDYFKLLLNQIISSETKVDETQGRNFIQMCVKNLVEANPTDPETKTDSHGSMWTNEGLTKEDLVANAILFILARYETTASSLHYIFFELAHHPEIQQRLYDDIKTHCSSANATYEELSKLSYLDWIIDETLRLYPPAARFHRSASSPVRIDGITLPTGGVVSASATLLHFNPDNWPEPYTFDPERFSPEVKATRHPPCAWVPFGVGNRNCIGMRLALLEMKAAIVGVMWNFEMITTPETVARPITEFYINFTNTPKSPIILNMKPRSE